jgi:hypothetical protein
VAEEIEEKKNYYTSDSIQRHLPHGTRYTADFNRTQKSLLENLNQQLNQLNQRNKNLRDV